MAARFEDFWLDRRTWPDCRGDIAQRRRTKSVPTRLLSPVMRLRALNPRPASCRVSEQAVAHRLRSRRPIPLFPSVQAAGAVNRTGPLAPGRRRRRVRRHLVGRTRRDAAAAAWRVRYRLRPRPAERMPFPREPEIPVRPPHSPADAAAAYMPAPLAPRSQAPDRAAAAVLSIADRKPLPRPPAPGPDRVVAGSAWRSPCRPAPGAEPHASWPEPRPRPRPVCVSWSATAASAGVVCLSGPGSLPGSGKSLAGAPFSASLMKSRKIPAATWPPVSPSPSVRGSSKPT